MYKGQEFLNWWYGTGKKKVAGFDPNCPKCVQEKAAQEALHSGFDPNCAQCIEERAVKQQAQPVVIKSPAASTCQNNGYPSARNTGITSGY